MKTRNGFVSNSSSSSFICIDYSPLTDERFNVFTTDNCILVVDGSNGITEFGWGPETITDSWSRLNFCYLQALYANRQEWIIMLEKLLEKRCGISEVEWDINLEYDNTCYVYIDHQSCASEDRNTEMFDSETNLEHFIFGKGSKIVLDNDNSNNE